MRNGRVEKLREGGVDKFTGAEGRRDRRDGPVKVGIELDAPRPSWRGRIWSHLVAPGRTWSHLVKPKNEV